MIGDWLREMIGDLNYDEIGDTSACEIGFLSCEYLKNVGLAPANCSLRKKIVSFSF